MVEISSKNFGPSHNLTFPTHFDEAVIASKTSLQRNQTFMLPKVDSQGSRMRIRSESWSSKYETVGSVLKPIGYSIQPPAVEVAPIHLQLESKFIWPDREFSISMWFLLEDNTINRLDEEQRGLIMVRRSLKNQSVPLYCYNENWCENGCEELFHLFSYGSSNATFEVWVGARTGHLQYR